MKARFVASDYTGAKPRFSLCLLHGNEPDLIEERSAELTRLVAGSSNDPFRVATLGGDDHAQLGTECTAGSLSGGRRVVRVRDCGERILPALLRLTASGLRDVTVILLAGVLRKSKLRIWAEEAAAVAAVLCNTDDPAQRRLFVDETMQKSGVTAARDTRALLLERLPPGRRAIVSEVEKLALLATSGEVDWEDARALLEGDTGGTAQAAIEAALAGDVAAAVTGWEQAHQAGTSGVALIRILGSELGRLAALRAETDRGTSVQDALQRQWIYPRDPRFRRWTALVGMWTGDAVLRALALAHTAERACKSTGSDERLVVAEVLATLADGHARPATRSG